MQFFNNNNYIPPSPIGDPLNNIPIGSTGYNSSNNNMGGYYTNNYGYYNPYLEEEKKKQEEIRKKEQARQEFDVMKVLSLSANKCNGTTINDERLEEMYAPQYQEDISLESKNQLMLLNNYYNIQDCNSTVGSMMEAQSRVYEYRQSLVPKDCNLYEFMDKSILLVDEIQRDEEKKRNAENLAKLYNKEDYRKIVGVHTGDSENYFSSMYDNNDPLNVSIDDVESKFPPYKQSENAKERQNFMNKILSEIEKRNSGGYGIG